MLSESAPPSPRATRVLAEQFTPTVGDRTRKSSEIVRPGKNPTRQLCRTAGRLYFQFASVG